MFLAAACSPGAEELGNEEPAPPTTSVEVADSPPPFDGPSVDGPLVLSFPRSDSEEAIIQGVVEINEDGCVTIEGAPVAWPPGTTWDDATQSIMLSSGDLVVAGDTVVGDGGFQGAGSLEFSIGEEGAAIAAACSEGRGGRVAVFNAESEVMATG